MEPQCLEEDLQRLLRFYEKIKVIKGVLAEELPIVLVGTKADIVESILSEEAFELHHAYSNMVLQVSTDGLQEAKILADNWQCPLMTSSAKTGLNCCQAFLAAQRELQRLQLGDLCTYHVAWLPLPCLLT